MRHEARGKARCGCDVLKAEGTCSVRKFCSPTWGSNRCREFSQYPMSLRTVGERCDRPVLRTEFRVAAGLLVGYENEISFLQESQLDTKTVLVATIY